MAQKIWMFNHLSTRYLISIEEKLKIDYNPYSYSIVVDNSGTPQAYQTESTV